MLIKTVPGSVAGSVQCRFWALWLLSALVEEAGGPEPGAVLARGQWEEDAHVAFLHRVSIFCHQLLGASPQAGQISPASSFPGCAHRV